MLLPWTVRAFNDDGRFNTVNKEENNGKPKYSQRYRIRENGKNERDLGDIVNSPIVAVGGYLATSANDGMVHIFKQSGGDKRGYNLKLSYIPGTMPRKNIERNDLNPCQRAARLCRKKLCGRPLRRGRRLCFAPSQIERATPRVYVRRNGLWRQRRVCLGFDQSRQQ